MFPLLRYFSFASLISVVVTTALLGMLHHQIEREQLLDIGESNHVALTQALANSLLPQFRHFAAVTQGLDIEALRAHPEFAALRMSVIEVLRSTPVVKLKLYELSGRTIFSTDPSQIGKDYRDNPGFISSLKGRPLSELTHRERFSAFDREIEERDVLSSYVALRAGKDEPAEGVLEVYSDVTDWIERTDRQAWVVTLATIAAFAALYGVLYVIVRHADGMIRTQHEQLQRSAAELRIAATAFESQQSMVVTDARGVILRANRAFSAGTGYSPEEAIGQSLSLLKSGRHDAAFFAGMWAAITGAGFWEGEIWNRRKSGEVHPDWLTITAVYGSSGEITHYVATLMDITQRKEDEERIKSLAFYDPLTQLPNRRLLQDRLRHALDNAARSDRHGAVMFIDLDHFKEINDTLGHEIGDRLLCEAAQRLKSCVRENDTVARLGGDEFVVMLEFLGHGHAEARAQAAEIGEKILSTLGEAYALDGTVCRSTPSIGIALFGSKDSSASEILKRADRAMYQVKEASRNAVRFS